MKRQIFKKLPACSSALRLSLLLGALSAAALANGSGAGVSPATAGISPMLPGSEAGRPMGGRDARPTSPLGQTTLTPAAPVSSQVPASSQEDIRGIRQPRHLPTPLPWAAVATGVITLAAAAYALWTWIRRGKFLQMPPYQVALQYLEEALRLMDPDQAREYGFAVSTIIRRYLEERFHFHAPTLTTEEFLRDLVEVRATMLAPHRALLGEFLQHCDLAKFAGWRYSRPDLEAMHASARTFVQQTAVDPAPAKRKAEQPAPATTASESPAPLVAGGCNSPVPFAGERPRAAS